MPNFPGDDEEDSDLTFEQRMAIKLHKERESHKRNKTRKQAAEEERLRKEPMPDSAGGTIAAIHEWLRALFGLPRLSTSLSASTSQASATALLEHHLPATPTDHEIDTWFNYSTRRSKFLDTAVKTKMGQHQAKNPHATDAAKRELRKNATKEAVEAFNKMHLPVKFVSRVVNTTTSFVSYDFTWLQIAESSFASSGFPRATCQWISALTTYWNMATIDILVTTWLDCYNARAIPPAYTIDSKLDLPKVAKQIVCQWISNKRRVYHSQAKEKNMLATYEGTEHLLKKVKTEKERAAMRRMRNKVSVQFCFSSHFFLL